MIQRDDIVSTPHLVPGYLQKLLRDRYGTNPHGEPNYRLIWGPSRMEFSGGLFNDFVGEAKTTEDAIARPLVRRVYQLRKVRKYANPEDEAYIIERWIPPEAYCSPEQWELPITQGGTIMVTPEGRIPTLGPYPRHGDYEDIGARIGKDFNFTPTERIVTYAVDRTRRILEDRNLASYAQQRVIRAQNEQEERDRKRAELDFDILSECDQAFHGAPMVGSGGTHRHSSVELCERLGIRAHPF